MTVAAATTAVFLLAGWHGRKPVGAPFNGSDHRAAQDGGSRYVAPASAPPVGDVVEAIGIALKRLAPVIVRQAVRVDVAARHGLLVRMRGPALADLLEELLALSIHSAPASMLLLTASARGDRIYVTFSDDVPNADLAVRQGQVRGVAERVALRGGALGVDTRANEGTTVTLRLAAAIDAAAEPVQQPAARAVQVPARAAGLPVGR